MAANKQSTIGIFLPDETGILSALHVGYVWNLQSMDSAFSLSEEQRLAKIVMRISSCSILSTPPMLGFRLLRLLYCSVYPNYLRELLPMSFRFLAP
jgi:hypothetical protein